MPSAAERLRQAYPALPGRAGVGSIPAKSDALNVPSFRRWRFEMKLSPFFVSAAILQSQEHHKTTSLVSNHSDVGVVGLNSAGRARIKRLRLAVSACLLVVWQVCTERKTP
jgi:hypothetical protein